MSQPSDWSDWSAKVKAALNRLVDQVEGTRGVEHPGTFKAPDVCEWPDCEQPTTVGWGEPPEWFCTPHFTKHLRLMRERLGRIPLSGYSE